MKKLLSILALLIAITGCNNHNQDGNSPASKEEMISIKKKKDDSIAKHKLDSIEVEKNKLYEVSGKVLYRKMWCGGVQIRANDNSYKSTPFINKKIVVIHGDINSDTCKRIMELRTDSKGEFEFSAKAGKYGIVIEDWKQVKFVPSVDLNDDVQTMQCLKDEYKKPDLVIQVINKAVSNLSYTVIGYCSGGNPCNPNMGNNRP